MEQVQSYPHLSNLFEICFNTVLSVFQSSKLCYPFKCINYSVVLIHTTFRACYVIGGLITPLMFVEDYRV
jgi:hypothetical protein